MREAIFEGDMEKCSKCNKPMDNQQSYLSLWKSFLPLFITKVAATKRFEHWVERQPKLCKQCYYKQWRVLLYIIIFLAIFGVISVIVNKQNPFDALKVLFK